MKPISILTLAMVLLFGSYTSKAQETNNNEPATHYKYGIGGGAGFATGYGLSFRYIPKNFGAQVNFAPYKTAETERYSVGITFIQMLIKSKYSNLFAYQANHFYSNSQMVYVYDPKDPNKQTMERQKESYFNNGLGFGIEIVMAKRIGLNLMAGYAFYDNFKQLNVTGETALYYKF